MRQDLVVRPTEVSHSIISWMKNYNTHYSYVTMGAMAPQISSLTIVNSTVYSGANQRKHQSNALQGGHRWMPRTNGQ